MKRAQKISHRWSLFLFSVLLLGGFGNLRAADELKRREWTIDGVMREALLYLPMDAKAGKTQAAPVVFAFHGHGGSMQNAARTFHIETLWPEAIVVYMQGLNTPGRLTDPEGKRPGWQRNIGDQDDRDLKFFDAVLASLKKDYKVDAKRVYSTGHSNGGAFTYLLWEARGKLFAAFAPSASAHRELILSNRGRGRESALNSSDDEVRRLTSSATKNREFLPKPVLHVAGENDPLVKFEWQKMMIEALRKLNQCSEGNPWEEDKRCTIYKSKAGGDVVTYITPGKHNFPREAPEIIVNFFKGYSG